MTDRDAVLARVGELVDVMDRLRSPGGCPWDARQTHASLAPYAVEEAFEVADAVAGGDRADLVDELGDLLLQVVFQARVGEDGGDARFDLGDVAAAITAKLHRRHPHVFADGDASTPDDVEASWERIKAAEKPERTGPLDGIPSGLPPLERAAKVASRLRRSGVGEDRLTGAVDAVPAGPGRDLVRAAFAAGAAGDDPGTLLREALAHVERDLGA